MSPKSKQHDTIEQCRLFTHTTYRGTLCPYNPPAMTIPRCNRADRTPRTVWSRARSAVCILYSGLLLHRRLFDRCLLRFSLSTSALCRTLDNSSTRYTLKHKTEKYITKKYTYTAILVYNILYNDVRNILYEDFC